MDTNTFAQSYKANYKGMTGDKRLDARAQNLWNNLCRQPASTISKLSSTRAEQIAYYRLLENQKLTEQDLINELTNRVKPLATGKDLLCMEDTSEINVCENKKQASSQ